MPSDRPPRRFKEGDLVTAQVFPMSGGPRTTMPGKIQGNGRWDEDHHPCWYYGVELDGPGGTLNCQCNLRSLDPVTKLGDVVRDV